MPIISNDQESRATQRIAVGVLYLSMSIPLGSWISRIPDVKVSLAASDSTWGFANTLGTAGELTGFVAISALVGRIGTRYITLVATALVIVLSPIVAFAPSLTMLIVALFLWMLASKAVGTTMGALALVEQRALGRPIMGRFDAVYSVGMLAGGGQSWLAIRLGIPPGPQLAVTNIALLVALLLSARLLPDEEQPQSPPRLLTRLRARMTPYLAVLSGISFFASVIDSSSSQWGAIYVTTIATSAAGALVYPIMMTAKAMTLLAVDRLSVQFGWKYLCISSMVLIGAGSSLWIIFDSPTVVIGAFAIVGSGTACLGPMVNTAITMQRKVSAGEARTVLEFGELPAYIAMPALIGVLAEALDLNLLLTGVFLLSALACALLLAGLKWRPDQGVIT